MGSDRKTAADAVGISSEKLRRRGGRSPEETAGAACDRYNGRDNDQQVPRQLRQSRHRRPLPEHPPRESYWLEPTEFCCPDCGSDIACLSEVSAEQLELVSSALKVIRTVRVKNACT